MHRIRRRPRRSLARVRFSLQVMLAFVVSVGVLAVPRLADAAPSDPDPGPGGKSVPVSPVQSAKTTQPDMPLWKPVQAAWPAGGSGTVAVDAGQFGAAKAPSGAAAARPGGLPVVVRAPIDDPGAEPRTAAELQTQLRAAPPASVRVNVLDRAAAESAGVKGVLFTVERADRRSGRAPVALDIDYSGFAGMYGADYALRLQLVQFPTCVLTTPGRPECAATPVKGSRNVESARVLSVDRVTVDGDSAATAAAASDRMVFAAVASTSSAAGDYSQTSLSLAGSWEAGKNSGNFSYSYPIRVPPAVGGAAPNLALQYSSGSVDGRSLRQNSQASWAGMGWDLNVGFIERQYRPCTDDNMSYQDLCWYTDNASMSFNGRSVRLGIDSSGNWRALDDTGLKIERFYGSPNNSTRGEYWKITDLDGTQYFFGRGYRGTETENKTWSAQIVPVYGNNPGEPCYAGGSMYNARCWQVYRWNLDYVIDPRGNSTTYFYSPYDGSYGGMLGTHGGANYTITTSLQRIEYGTRAGQEATGNAPQRVNLNVSVRCLDGTVCQGQTQNWPDTPWDLYCPPGGLNCPYYSPSFWTPYKLDSVVTQVWNSATNAYVNVDQYQFGYVYPSNGDHVAPAGDDTTPSLWLNTIVHNGVATGTGIEGAAVQEPVLHFGGNKLPNRVSWGSNASGAPPLMHWRLVQIQNNAGGRTDVSYDSWNCSATAANPAIPSTDVNSLRCWPQWYNGAWVWFHKYVVDTVAEHDLTGGGPPEVWNYDYAGWGSSNASLWRYDTNEITPAARRSWTDWRGYPIVTTTHGPVGGPQTVTRDLYYRGFNGDRTASMGWRAATITDSQGVTVSDEPFLVGTVREHTVLDSSLSGGIASSTIHEPSFTHMGGAYPNDIWQHHDQFVRTRTWLARNSSWRWTKAEYGYDSYNLITRVANHGDEAVTGDETCTSTSYARNAGAYLMNYPSQSVTRAGPGCVGTDPRIGESQTFYDATTTLGAAPSRGLPTRTRNLLSAGPDVWATTESGHDLYGRLTSSTDARGKTSTIAYTPATGGPLTQTTSTNPLGHTTTKAIHPGLGLPVSTTDPNSKVTTARHDALGRLTKVWQPGHPTSGTPTVEYAYALSNTAANVVTTKKIGPNGTQVVSYELFDGRFRSRQTQQPAPQANGGRIVDDTAYDGRGLTAKTSAFWNSAAPAGTLVTFSDANVASQTRMTYDLLERTTAEQTWSLNVMKWQGTLTYDGDRTSVLPPTGGTPTTMITDAAGNTVELRQHTNGVIGGSYQSTWYTYDRLNRLTQIKDPANNVWSRTYDVGGRVTSSTDPDRGTSTITYNAANDILTTTDARGVTLAFAYDNLGRKTSLWQGAVGTGTKRSEWIYDTLASGGTAKGQVIKSIRWHDNAAYSVEVTGFTDSYQPLGSTVRLPASMGTLAGPWTTTISYNINNSVASKTYPAAGSLPAETVTTTYDNNGYPLTLVGLDTYVSATSYHNGGRAYQRILGTGTKRVRLQTSLDEATGRLTENRVSTENQATPNTWVPQLIEQYGYDNSGNVTTIKEVTGAGTAVSNQCFTYDRLSQLTEAWTTTAATCQATPSQPVVGGPDSYWTSYRYNAIGNRTQDTAHTPAGDTARTFTYPASGTTSTRPHAVTNVVATGLLPGTDTYTYDATGNTKTRNVTGKPNQTLTWDPEGQLESVSDSGGVSSYIYTAEGDRLLSSEPGAVTVVYLGDYELRRTNTGVTCTRNYGVAARSTTGGLTWLATDHHNTGQLAIDPSTLAVKRRRTDPFGDIRGATVSWPTTRGFVNGVQDGTGLVHLGAREYESTTGRFISVDPVFDDLNPQQFNGYTYGGGNPATNDDPDGLCFGRDEGDFCPGSTAGPWAPPKVNPNAPQYVGSTENVTAVTLRPQKGKNRPVVVKVATKKYSWYINKGNVVRRTDGCAEYGEAAAAGPVICEGLGQSESMGKATPCQRGNNAGSFVCYVGPDGYAYDVAGNQSCLKAGAVGPCGGEGNVIPASSGPRKPNPSIGPSRSAPPSIGPGPPRDYPFISAGYCLPFACFAVTAAEGGIWAGVGHAVTTPGGFVAIGSQTASMDATGSESIQGCAGYFVGACVHGGPLGAGSGVYAGAAFTVGTGPILGAIHQHSRKIYTRERW